MRQYVSFTGLHAGTVELSLGLHASRQLSDKVLRYLKHAVTCATSDFSEAGHDFSRPPHVAVRVGLYHHRVIREVRRAVSEGSDLLRDWPSLRIVRTLRLLPQIAVRKDSRRFPHIAEFCDPLGRGS